MSKVINGILFTKMYIVFDDDISPQLEKFTDFAIKLETIDTFYDITGINEMIQVKAGHNKLIQRRKVCKL